MNLFNKPFSVIAISNFMRRSGTKRLFDDVQPGVCAVKADVRLSQDGVPVVIRDITVDNMTSGEGFVSYHTAEELRELGIPALSEVLLGYQALKSKSKSAPSLTLELRTPRSASKLAAVLTPFLSANSIDTGELLVSSLLHKELSDFKKLLPSVPIAVCIEGVPHDYATAVSKLNAQALFVNADYLEQSMVHEAKCYGSRVFAQVVNNPNHIARLRDFGVDGVMTEAPESVLRLVAGDNVAAHRPWSACQSA